MRYSVPKETSQTAGSKEPPPILIVDDDSEFCDLTTEYLAQEGFEVTAVYNGADALTQALSGKFSLMILDVMLPRIKGFDVLRLLRSQSNMPVIMLTARCEDVDRILGLEIGADDYLSKPVNPRELTARINAVLRRTSLLKVADITSGKRFVVGDIEMDIASRSVWKSNEELDLTSVEFDLLRALVAMAGKVVTRERLVRTVLGRDLVHDDRSIDVHLSNLRKKLSGAPDGSNRIKTIRGVGYVYAVPAQPKNRK